MNRNVRSIYIRFAAEVIIDVIYSIYGALGLKKKHKVDGCICGVLVLV